VYETALHQPSLGRAAEAITGSISSSGATGSSSSLSTTTATSLDSIRNIVDNFMQEVFDRAQRNATGMTFPRRRQPRSSSQIPGPPSRRPGARTPATHSSSSSRSTPLSASTRSSHRPLRPRLHRNDTSTPGSNGNITQAPAPPVLPVSSSNSLSPLFPLSGSHGSVTGHPAYYQPEVPSAGDHRPQAPSAGWNLGMHQEPPLGSQQHLHGTSYLNSFAMFGTADVLQSKTNQFAPSASGVSGTHIHPSSPDILATMSYPLAASLEAECMIEQRVRQAQPVYREVSGFAVSQSGFTMPTARATNAERRPDVGRGNNIQGPMMHESALGNGPGAPGPGNADSGGATDGGARLR
jgi:hypothetical protein